eukprot:1437996-Pyramimonas_sp.AAC.1
MCAIVRETLCGPFLCPGGNRRQELLEGGPHVAHDVRTPRSRRDKSSYCILDASRTPPAHPEPIV